MEQWRSRVSPEHVNALMWFAHHAGAIVPWSTLQPEGLLLATKAVGIRVPQGWDYALSVRETLSSPYLDSAVTNLPNGDWIYRYHRQTTGAHARHNNAGLIRSMEDGVPIGVVIQQTPKPNVTYWILGLGTIVSFDDEWFTIAEWRENRSVSSNLRGASSESNELLPVPAFDPDSLEYGREVRLQAISVRQGQGRFRAQLLQAYNRKCAFTGSFAVPALDAAHIHPYSGKASNNPTNGLLLRTDTHKLFDLGLIAVNSASMTLLISSRLKGTEYESFRGRPINMPSRVDHQPSKKALDRHRESTGL